MPKGPINQHKKRNTGRKPNWYRDWCDKAVTSPKMLKKLEDALESPVFDIWFTVFKELQVIAHGKPGQDLNLKFPQGRRIIIEGDNDSGIGTD